MFGAKRPAYGADSAAAASPAQGFTDPSGREPPVQPAPAAVPPMWACEGQRTEKLCTIKSDKRDKYGPATPGEWNEDHRTYGRQHIGELSIPNGEKSGHVAQRDGRLELTNDDTVQGYGRLKLKVHGGRGWVSAHAHEDKDGFVWPEWHSRSENDAVTLDDPRDSGGPGGLSMITHRGRIVELYVDKEGVLTAQTYGDVTDAELKEIRKFLDNGQRELARRARNRKKPATTQ